MTAVVEKRRDAIQTLQMFRGVVWSGGTVQLPTKPVNDKDKSFVSIEHYRPTQGVWKTARSADSSSVTNKSPGLSPLKLSV